MRTPLPKINFQNQSISFRQAARLSGIPYDTLRSRYLRGDRGDDLFRPVQESSARHMPAINGKTQTLRQWADELGIRYETLRQRVMRGSMDGIEYRLESKPHARRGKGAGTSDLKKLAEEHGLPYATVLNRHYKGWTGSALVKPVKKHMITHQGKTQSLRQWADEYDISYSKLLMRFSRGMKDPEKLFYKGQLNSSDIGIVEQDDYRKHILTYLGKTQTLAQWVEELGIPYKRVYMRMGRGETDPEKILCNSLRKPIVHVTYQGKTQDLKAWAQELGVQYRTLLRRIERGETDPEKILRPVESSTDTP